MSKKPYIIKRIRRAAKKRKIERFIRDLPINALYIFSMVLLILLAITAIKSIS